MIRANKLCLPRVCAALACAGLVSAAPPGTSEITSNDMWSVDGNGDTVWVLTARGVNYTTNALAESPSWQGYYSNDIRDVVAYGISYHGGTAIVPLFPRSGETANDILIFSASKKPSSVRFDFKRTSLRGASDPEFFATAAEYLDGYWWLSCTDGGVVRMGSDTTVLYPGTGEPVEFEAFKTDSFSSTGAREDAQTVALDAHAPSHSLWVVQRRALWRLRTDSLSWTMISDTAVDTAEMSGVWAWDSNRVLVRMHVASPGEKSPSDTGSLYAFASGDGVSWERSRFTDEKAPFALTFLDSEHVYLVRGNDVKHWADIDTIGIVEKGFAEGGSYSARQLDFDVVSPVINDIFYTTTQDTGILWIPTTEGLFLSYSKDFRPDSLRNLAIIRRDKTVPAGLKNRNVYAFPSILNDSYKNQRAVFAYNLEEDDDVTIDIFDWNMDHVIRIIENRFRYAGKNRPDGRARSTDAGEDSWDGTFNNNNGTRVEPGVYYFRVKSRKNGRAFGKLVVAKPEF
ncbi:MAG: hypothetical protein GF418_12750 [Chitinivibrionales bacterium]|nr:hypothetical protein [Chitinivibrionales bacterium]MBD3396489.1 hypothetical protein [Chitinivibrionales bacterium]